MTVCGDPGGFINRLRNGTFTSWTNGTSGTIGPSPSGYAAIAASGWAVLPTGASVDWSQANAGYNGTTQSLRVTGATSVTDVVLAQRIESADAAQLAGRQVTFQLAVYNNTGGSITPTLATRYAGSTDVWTSPVSDLSATNLQPCANAAWTAVAYTFTTSGSAINGYEIKIDFGNNFGAGSNYVQVTAADLRVTAGVSTGLNSYPPPPELPTVPSELHRNARYYQSSFANGTAPGTATHAGMVGPSYYIDGVVASSVSIPFPVEMRATPSLRYWDGAAHQNATSVIPLAGGTTFTDNGAIGAPWNPSPRGFFMSPGVSNFSYYLHYAAYADFW
jgi:hypothetical protein